MRLGIDFGTSSSSAAFMVGGHVQSVIDPNNSEAAMFSSSICLMPPQEFRVGQAADDEQWSEPKNYRHQLKRDLGREDPLLGGFGVVDLVVRILKKVKHDADAMMRSQGQRAFTGAVIGIPLTFGDHQKKQMLQAASMAGFVLEEIDLVPEPEAAALYYVNGGHLLEQQDVQEGERILIYDLGGGTFDAAFIQKKGDTYQPLAPPAGLAVCGGADFDRAIYQDMLAKYPQLATLVAIDPSAPEPEQTAALLARSTLGDAARKIKHRLSTSQEATTPLPLHGLTTPLYYRLTRQDFIVDIEASLAKTYFCCKDMLQQAGFSWEDVDRIVLVGGSCHIPYVEEYLTKETHRPVAKSLRLESVVCQGLARYAAYHQVYTVSPQQGAADFTTLTAAIKQAQEPSRIVLYPGVHQEEEQVVIEQEGLTIMGSGEREQVVLETHARIGVKVACKTTTIQNLTLRHQPSSAHPSSRSSRVYGGGPLGAALLEPGQTTYRRSRVSVAEPAGGVVVTQGYLALVECALEASNQVLVIQGSGSRGELMRCHLLGGSEAGLAVHNGAQADLSECVIQRSKGIGILVSQKQSQLSMDRCHISESAGVGLSLRNGAQGSLSNCRIEQNTLTSLQIQDAGTAMLTRCHICAGQGIGLAVERAGRVQAEECFFGNNAGQCILLSDKGSQATLLKCQIQDGHTVGLEIVKQALGILEDCQLYCNAGPALRVSGKGSQITVSKGTIRDNAYVGVLLSEEGQGEFQALTLSDNAGPAVRIARAGTKATLEDCLITRNGAGLVIEEQGEGTCTHCKIEKNKLDVYVEPGSTLDSR